MMNKMPCHITDEYVYNPWDYDGEEEDKNMERNDQEEEEEE